MIQLTPDRARRLLLTHLHLRQDVEGTGEDGCRQVLRHLRMVQLDPLDRIGTNADLVAAARVSQVRKGQIYSALLPGHAFEHFAKERCLLPSEAFPAWRDHAAESPWWRQTQRMKRVDPTLVADVLAEVTARGPVTPAELADRGRVEPLDWSGWKGTSKAATMAIRVLWTRCQVVVTARRGRQKVYDIPSRCLPQYAAAHAPEDAQLWQLQERIRAAGLMPRGVGPWWGGLRAVRDTRLKGWLEDGTIVAVGLPGTRKVWLTLPELLDTREVDDDGRMRILGPLDPLLWDRDLVRRCFDFTYLWEVYKPAAKRKWGYYVCPLLHQGQLVGRIEARIIDGRWVTEQVWDERGIDPAAFQRAVERHARVLGAAPPDGQ